MASDRYVIAMWVTESLVRFEVLHIIPAGGSDMMSNLPFDFHAKGRTAIGGVLGDSSRGKASFVAILDGVLLLLKMASCRSRAEIGESSTLLIFSECARKVKNLAIFNGSLFPLLHRYC